MLNLKSYLASRRDMIEDRLSGIMQNASAVSSGSSRLLQAVNYSLMAGGKRLRPILCMAAAEATGGSPESVMRAACALEMIHTYSLIHDDLPAMDNDDLRRGQPTCHIAYNEATALLAGDALLTLCFQILSSTDLDPVESPRSADAGQSPQAGQWLKVVQIISTAAGFQGMIEGQMRDIISEGRQLTRDELKAMHNLKTGALIEASVHSGAVLGGGSPDQIEKLCCYAKNAGLAFQVADDILNIEGDPKLMGKAVGTDESLNKATYPSLMGLAASKAYAEELVHNALQALNGFDDKSDPLRAVATYIIERKR